MGSEMRRALTFMALALGLVACGGGSRAGAAEPTAPGTTPTPTPTPVVAACAGEPLVFLLAGQSNMLGQAEGKDLPVAMQTPPPCVELHHNGRAIPLLPNDGNHGYRFGPEIGFGHAMAAALPGRRIVLVKRSIGGTSLAKDWDPTRPAGLFAELVHDYRQVTLDLPHRLVAVLWSQGGEDAERKGTAEAYGTRLQAFIASLREAVGAPDLLFILSGSRPEDPQTPQMLKRTPYLTTVRAANVEVTRTVPHTAMVTTAGLTYNADGRHHDAPGQLEFGRRFAAMVLEHEPSIVPAAAP
jgi:hypothetical protein